MSDKHPTMVALERFYKKNPDVCNSTTLGAASTDNQYLRNRIESAFQEGWDARIAYEMQRKLTK